MTAPNLLKWMDALWDILVWPSEGSPGVFITPLSIKLSTLHDHLSEPMLWGSNSLELELYES